MSTTKDLYDEYLITSMVPGFAPVEVERASGTVYYGTDGREYLDCFSGISVTNAGSGHPKITAAAKEQIDKLVHCCTYVYYSPRAGELAKRMAEVSPGQAEEEFLRQQRRGGDRRCDAPREAPHGQERDPRPDPQLPRADQRHALHHGQQRAQDQRRSVPVGNCVRARAPTSTAARSGPKTEEECGERAASYLADTIKYQTAGNVAAFVAEPILGEGGIITPPANYFKLVKEILEANDILFICDEVQTGFGRTGKLFAIEHYGVDPDIMTTAKGIANGFPLGAFTATPEIGDAFTVG